MKRMSSNIILEQTKKAWQNFPQVKTQQFGTNINIVVGNILTNSNPLFKKNSETEN